MKRRDMVLMNSMCWKSLARYIKTYRLTTNLPFLSWRKSGIRRPNRTEKNRLT